MSETGRIWDLLQRAYEGGDAWRCPSLRELLGSVTAAQAAARPIPGARSLWELLAHLTAYEDVVRRRVEGESACSPPDEVAWPRVEDGSPAGWRQAKARFEEGHRRLRQAVAALPDSRLTDAVPGREYPVYVLLYGAVQHRLYHAGQMEMLMAAQGVRPPGPTPPALRERDSVPAA